MSHATLSRPGGTGLPGSSSQLPLFAVLGLWLAAVLALGAAGAFVNAPGAPPLAILFGVLLPLAVFGAAWVVSAAFRELVLGFDLQFAAGVQAWRLGGFSFLVLYVYGILPGVFALPAGLGDMAVGLTAPGIVAALAHRPGFVASRAFRTWNLFGVLDLVVAVSLGGLSSFLANGSPGEITSAPMARLPLVLIPAYLVPMFLMLHATALLQARRLR